MHTVTRHVIERAQRRRLNHLRAEQKRGPRALNVGNPILCEPLLRRETLRAGDPCP
jgi:hypothetical protein